MTELEQALIEARAAVAVAEEKITRLRAERWKAAAEATGQDDVNELLSPGWNEMLEALDKLPDVEWQTGCFYHQDGDYLHVFWHKPDAVTVRRWVNHLVSLHVQYDEDGEERIVGCVVDGAKGVLERADVYLTPDPPNPSREVEEAKAAGVCRVCRVPLMDGEAPASTVERFGSMTHPHALVFNCGEEYAHQACLNREKAEGEAA